MIKITIDKKKYWGVYRWDEMTLQKFCDLAAIKMPKGYEPFILADARYDFEDKKTVDEYVDAALKITEEQLTSDFPNYYREVIECLTNIPYREVMLLSSERANEIYEYFKPFIISLIYHTPVIYFMGQIKSYEPLQLDRFRIGLNVFNLPESVTIMDQVIPLRNETIISYTEASDTFKGMKITKDDVKRLAFFMAIYCRKKGERYSEEKTIARQDLFLKAPMSVVWSVFFYTVQRLPASSIAILLFSRLPHQIREARDRAIIYKDLAVEDLSMKFVGTEV